MSVCVCVLLTLMKHHRRNVNADRTTIYNSRQASKLVELDNDNDHATTTSSRSRG